MSRRRSNVRQYSAEEQALTDISQEAENRLAAKRAARAEAREIRMKEIERQHKEAEEKERLGSDCGTRSRPQSVAGSTGSRRGSFESSEGTNDSTSTRDLKMELRTLQEKYKGAMMTSAQLDNEKQSLVYQVELLKDQLEELTEGHTELQREYKDKNRDLEMTKRELKAAQLEAKALHEQNDYKDRLIKESGLVIVAAEDGELALERSKESPSTNGPVGTGGLLLSSESLVLLNKGREGSLGMHSLASSHSTTHTTQSAPSTGLSQPPSHAHAGELKSEGIVQTQSAESTASNQEEGSSVDGPMFQGSPKDSETSSSHEAGDAEADVFAEAADALSEQPGATVSHSPDGRNSENLAQEAGRTASASNDDVGSTSLVGQAMTEQVSEVAVEGMGSESTEKSTSGGMITPLHGSDFCEDKGWKVSDGAEGTEQSSEKGPDLDVDQADSGFDGSQYLSESKSGTEYSQSDLPSVVVTECSHSQRIKSQDSEEDEVDEFFDAVSTPLPSPMDKEFEFQETEIGSGGNSEVQVSETVSSDISEKDAMKDGKEVIEESGKPQSVGEDGKEVAEEDSKEVIEESGKPQSVGEDGKEVAEEDSKEAVENPSKQMDDESSKVSDGEGSGEADESCKQVDSKEADKGEGIVAGEEGGKVEVEEEDAKLGGEDFMQASGETGLTLTGDDKEETAEVCENTCEGDIGKTSDEQNLQKDVENADREGDEHDKQEIECKDTESDSERLSGKSDQTSSEMIKDLKQSESTNSDVCDDSKPENNVDTVGETVEEVGDDGVNKEETVEQIPESKKDDASLGACEVGDTAIESNENVSQQVHSHIDDAEESDEKREELPASSVEPSGNEPEDIQNSKELDLDTNSERPATVSEKDGNQTTSLSEEETDQSVPPESADEKHDLDSTEDTVMISQETSSDPSVSEPASSEDNSRKDAEGAVKEGSGIENKEGGADQEDKSEESEEVPDTLSPISSRKPVNRSCSEGGTSEDSEAQVNDDEYDFDDIDAVLDHGTTEASKGKDTEPGVDAESDDKVSFGSKDSGLQESFANKDSEANKEDTVSFGSRDSGLQESVSIKEKDSGSGDTVSMQSRDSGAGIEEISSVQSQDSGNAPEAEKGAVGGDSKSHPVTGSRESLDLEAKLDKMALAESGVKETPSKDKHGHKKSKKFKMFKKIFK